MDKIYEQICERTVARAYREFGEHNRYANDNDDRRSRRRRRALSKRSLVQGPLHMNSQITNINTFSHICMYVHMYVHILCILDMKTIKHK